MANGLDLSKVQQSKIASANDQLFDTFNERVAVLQQIAEAAGQKDAVKTEKVDTGGGVMRTRVSIDLKKFGEEEKKNLEKFGISFDLLKALANKNTGDGQDVLSSRDLSDKFGSFNASSKEGGKGFTEADLKAALKPAKNKAEANKPAAQPEALPPKAATPTIPEETGAPEAAPGVARTTQTPPALQAADLSGNEFLQSLVQADVLSKEIFDLYKNAPQNDEDREAIPVEGWRVDRLFAYLNSHGLKITEADLKNDALIDDDEPAQGYDLDYLLKNISTYAQSSAR